MMLPGIAEPQALPDPNDSDRSVGTGGAGYRCSSDLTNLSFQATARSEMGKKDTDVTLLFSELSGEKALK